MTQRYHGWRKSSHSDPDSECVEVGLSAAGAIAVRDSKLLGAGPTLEFSRADWTVFVRSVRAIRPEGQE